MSWIYFVGMRFKVRKMSNDEYRLFVPGERVYITLSRSSLERAIREQYGLKEKHPPKTARKLY
jgi:hypothetical protein